LTTLLDAKTKLHNLEVVNFRKTGLWTPAVGHYGPGCFHGGRQTSNNSSTLLTTLVTIGGQLA
jgi:hypothetical protein